jgi:hypothetical protein
MPSNLSFSLAMGFAFVTCCTAIAQEKTLAPDEAQIRAWIAALANPGPPRRFEYPDEQLTKEERENLKPVSVAYANLTKHFVAALPYLVESTGDKRYSYPQEHPSSGVFENQTVGRACRSIIEGKVLPDNPAVIDEREIAVWHHLPVDKDWYARVKGMSLFEMQVDSLDWLLKQPPPGRGSDKQWEAALQGVRKFREAFVAKGTAEDRTFGPPIEGK